MTDIYDELEPMKGEPWFITYTGKVTHVVKPERHKICIEDIAHGLSMICRFGGHVRQFYSVAQHCCIVADLLPVHLQFVGLMHDATEAYVGDMIGPLKRSIGQPYKAIEQLWWDAIADRFDLPAEIPDEVKVADVIALLTERRDLIAPNKRPWLEDELKYKAATFKIEPLTQQQAKDAFLRRYEVLNPARFESR